MTFPFATAGRSGQGVVSWARRKGLRSTTAIGAVLALPIAIASAPNCSYAQTAGADDARSIAEVVVTARRVSERLQDVPLSVTAISPTVVADKNIDSVYDIKALVPNVYMARTGVPAGGQLWIRGVAAQGLPFVALDTRVGVYIDGVYFSRVNGINSALSDVERIEVESGPQGTLFGRNVTGGAINFITADPTGEFGGRLEAGWGDYGRQRYRVTLNSPDFKGLSARVTYVHDEMDGDVKNLGAGLLPEGYFYNPTLNWARAIRPAAKTLGANNNEAFFFALRYDGIDNLNVVYKFDASENIDQTQGYQAIAIPPGIGGCVGAAWFIGRPFDACSPAISSGTGLAPAIPSPFNPPLSLKKHSAKSMPLLAGAWVRSQGHNLTAEYDVSETLTLKSITGYRRLTSYTQSDNGANGYLANPAFFNAIPNSPRNVPPGRVLCLQCSLQFQKTHWFTEEFQIIGRPSDAVNYLVGLYYFNEVGQGQNSFTLNTTPQFAYLGASYGPVAPGANLIPTRTFASGEFERINAKSYAAFGHIGVDVTDRLNLSAGLRYTIDKKRVRVPPVVVAALSPLSAGTDVSKTFKKLTYDGTATYKFTDDVNIYARYATAFLSGGLFSSVPYDTETSSAVELGVKSQWFDRRVTVNGAVFYQETKNQQDSGNTVTGSLFVRNIPGVTENRGAELAVSVAAGHGLSFDATAGYADVNFADGRLTPNPKWTLNLGTHYDGPKFGNGMYLSGSLDANYRSSWNMLRAPLNPNQPVTLPAEFLATQGYVGPNAQADYIRYINAVSKGGDYWIANARLSLVDIPVGRNTARVSAYVDNIFNKRGINSGVNLGATVSAIYEFDRRVGLDAQLQF